MTDWERMQYCYWLALGRKPVKSPLTGKVVGYIILRSV